MAELTLYGLPMVSITGAHPARRGGGRLHGPRAGAERGRRRQCPVPRLLAVDGHDPSSASTTRRSRSPIRRSTDAARRRLGRRPRRVLPGSRRPARHPPAPDRAEGDAEDRDAERPRRADHGADVAPDVIAVRSALRPADRRLAEHRAGDRLRRRRLPGEAADGDVGEGIRRGRKQKLILAQGQFFSANPVDGAQDGFQRLFTQIDGRVFISSNTDYAPPTFTRIDALKTGGTITFSAEVSLGAGRPCEAGARPLPRRQRPVRGRPSSSSRAATELWTGSAPTSAAAVQYFVQAVDSHGNVAVSTNKGYYFAGAAAPGQTGPSRSTSTALLQANGIYKVLGHRRCDAPEPA